MQIGSRNSSILKEDFALHCSKAARKPLILRENVGVVRSSTLGKRSGEPHRATPEHFFHNQFATYVLLMLLSVTPVNCGIHRRFSSPLTQFLHSSHFGCARYHAWFVGDSMGIEFLSGDAYPSAENDCTRRAR